MIKRKGKGKGKKIKKKGRACELVNFLAAPAPDFLNKIILIMSPRKTWVITSVTYIASQYITNK